MQYAITVPALEDRLVQLACAQLLGAIYEQDFLDCSYGYRTGRSAHGAIAELTRELQFGGYHYLVEADIRGFFDHMEHEQILAMLEERIDDRAFLCLIRKWLKAGILDRDGQVIQPDAGTPQGGIVSPILANLYLHHALDLWFEGVVRRHCQGRVMLVRYADDWVCAFQREADAQRFFRTLPKRLQRFGLEVAEEKTHCLRFDPSQLGKGNRFQFLGFEFYWDKDRKGLARVKRRTAPKKLQGACRRIKTWIKDNRHLPKSQFVCGVNRRLQGHYNYYGVIGNGHALNRFYRWTLDCVFKWLNRRGGKRRSFTWDRFWKAVNKGLFVPPRIVVGRVNPGVAG